MYKHNKKYKLPYKTAHRNFRSNQILLLTFLTMSVGSQVAQSNESNDYQAYPKASEDATQAYQLRSNMERTHFFIDDKELGVGKRLMVMLNNQGHTIVAQPENCEISKEEFVQPPYSAIAPLSFTFVPGDCEKPEIVADNSSKSGGISGITVTGGGTVNINTGDQNGTLNNSTPRERTNSSPQEKPKALKKPSVPKENKSIALNEIEAFVQKVCKSAEDKGESTNSEVSGTIAVGLIKLNRFFKYLPNLGAEGTGNHQNITYQGVPQAEVSNLISKSVDCRHDLSAMLINKVIN